MELNLSKAKNYHYSFPEFYLSISDDEQALNSFSRTPNSLCKLLDYPEDRSVMLNSTLQKLADMKKRDNAFSNKEPPEINRRTSRSPTNPNAKKQFVRKNIKGMKHLTVMIPEDGAHNGGSPKKLRADKQYWECIWDSLAVHFEGRHKKTRKIRSQSFDEYLCVSEKFIHHDSFMYTLRKLKKKVPLFSYLL